MPTQCVSEQFCFGGFGGRRVEAAFDGGALTSDAGALLLQEADRAIGLIDRVAACFRDERDPGRVVHVLRTLIGQRIIGLALGYEDVATTMTCVSIPSWRCSRIGWSRAVPTVRRWAARAR